MFKPRLQCCRKLEPVASETHKVLERRAALTGKKLMLAKHTCLKGHSKGTGRDHQGCCYSRENGDSMADWRQSQCSQQTTEGERDVHLCNTERQNKVGWKHQRWRSEQACWLASKRQCGVSWSPKRNLLWCDPPTHWLSEGPDSKLGFATNSFVAPAFGTAPGTWLVLSEIR